MYIGNRSISKTFSETKLRGKEYNWGGIGPGGTDP